MKTARVRYALFALLLSLPLHADEPSEAWVSAIQSPQYFAVSVEDVDRAVEWYETALGLVKLDDQEADDGRWRIVNMKNEQLFVEIIRDRRDASVDRARGFRKVGFRVPDVEPVADRIEQATGERPRIVEFARHGIYILQLKDPEGNTIQLTSAMEDTGQ